MVNETPGIWGVTVFKDEIVNFSKNGDTFAIKESRGVKVQIMKTLIS